VTIATPAIKTAESNASAFKSFRDLIAWQKSMDLVCRTYEQTKMLPPDERFGLIAQMRRSAVSVASNIAEGWGRHAGAEYIRFLEIARGSAYELSTQCEICMRLAMPGEWGIVVENCEEIGRILNGLMASIRKSMSRA